MLGRISLKYVQVQMISNSVNSKLEKSKMALIFWSIGGTGSFRHVANDRRYGTRSLQPPDEDTDKINREWKETERARWTGAS
jgi:hypothetical protein